MWVCSLALPLEVVKHWLRIPVSKSIQLRLFGDRWCLPNISQPELCLAGPYGLYFRCYVCLTSQEKTSGLHGKRRLKVQLIMEKGSSALLASNLFLCFIETDSISWALDTTENSVNDLQHIFAVLICPLFFLFYSSCLIDVVYNVNKTPNMIWLTQISSTDLPELFRFLTVSTQHQTLPVLKCSFRILVYFLYRKTTTKHIYEQKIKTRFGCIRQAH